MNVTTSDTDLSRPARKRQRIPLACGTCRDRKTKCNGDRPVCSACLRRGFQDTCDYEDGPSKTQKYIRELEDRIKELERGHLVVTSHVTIHPRNDTDESELSTACPTRNLSGVSELQEGELSLSYDEPNSVDALATVSSLDRTEGFYGDSSTIAFVSKVKDATNPEPHTTQNVHASPSEQTPLSGTGSLQGFQLTRNHDPSAFVLPPRKIADDFLYCFWEYIHPLFPVIHKPSLLDTYKKLWSPTSPQSSTAETELKDITFFSTLNLIFALGCQFSTQVPAEKKVVRAKQFYERSKSLLVVDILDAMHLPLVQALLLAGVYLQSTKHANRCWNVIGLAIRVAQGLGLHTEQLTSVSTDQVEMEMRRRIWHTCVMLDRLLAMTFGRPTTIPRTWNVEIPSMIDDEYLLHYGTASQPPNLHSRLGLFVYSTKLYEILDDILATFYIHDKGKLLPRQGEKDQRATDGLNEVLNLNSKLDEFLDMLPDYLKFHDELPSEHQEASHVKLQVNVLNSRFLYTRILLLRPVLLAMAQEQIGLKSHAKGYSELKLQQELATRACLLCISTAHKLIAQIHENLESVHRSSAWHSVYFTFAASTILIAAHLCNLDGVDANTEAFQISRTRSMTILEHYSPQVPSAFQAISVLKALRSRIFTSKRDATTDAPPTEQEGPVQQPTLNENSLLPVPNQGASGNISNTYLQETLQFDLDGIAPISDAWFTEQFINFDWLNTPWEQNGFNF